MTRTVVESTVLETWLSFEKAAIPADGGPNQRKAMEMAFYGGALAMFELLTRASTQDHDDLPSEREVSTVSALYAELEAWGDRELESRSAQ